MENYIGRLLDNRYEILEVIGTGGMAVVYKARCHRLNRLVAIKILKDDLSQDAEFRRRFHAESQAVAMLSHPNIVNVYDVSHSDNVDYIVMELIDGITLKQYLEQKKVLNWREVLHFATQIAKALEHAHSRGIIHRDIKPHNIMILKDGSVKVTDFGIARVSSSQSTLTREALGSVHYISPEQAKGSKIDCRSDLYSLGVVMYEMLTGRPPYDGETPVSVAIQHINAQAVPPRSLNSQVPVGLDQITMHVMAADPDDRYETATDMLCDLEEFRRNPNVNFVAAQTPADVHERTVVGRTAADRAVAGKTVQKREPQPRTKQKQSNAAALVAGVICIGLAVAFIGYFLWSFFLSDLFTPTEDVQVPNLLGLMAEELDSADYEDFTIIIEDWIPHDTVEMGRIISQSPSAERMVKSGSTISVVVSSGPSLDTMRDLVNQTERNARTILKNLNLDLDIQVEYENNDALVEGAVIRTVPAAEEQLSAGQTVTLYVSLGPAAKLVPVPELVGLPMETALEMLDARGLKPVVTYVDGTEAKDTVVFQSIKQGEEVKTGTTINLQVSNGPKDEEQTPVEDEKYPWQSDENILMLPMPSGDETVEVVVKLDDVEIDRFELDLVTVSDNGVPIAPEVSGIHRIDVYINGILWHTMDYNFDTGEQLQ